jgi:putative membrane protein
MTKECFLISLLSFSLLAVSCNNTASAVAGSTDSTNKDSATVNNTAGGTTAGDSLNQPVKTADTADAAFLKKAASGGLLEVELGSLTGTNGVSPRVKDFGQMMIKDHSDANAKLKTVAQQLGVDIPTDLLPPHAHHKMMLSEKKGTAFDKAYMKMMVEDHNEDIADFQKASNSNNPLVKNFASQTLPVLNKHLDSAKAIVAGPKQ